LLKIAELARTSGSVYYMGYFFSYGRIYALIDRTGAFRILFLFSNFYFIVGGSGLT